MSVSINTGNFDPFGKVVIISNGTAELQVTVDVGPRIISYKALGGDSFLYADIIGEAVTYNEKITEAYGKEKYSFYGGHRLWETPEIFPDTYFPDDDPVTWVQTPGGAIFTAPVRPNGLQYSIEVELADEGSQVSVIGRIKNAGDTPCEHAPWGITQVRRGGIAVFPQNTRDCSPLGNRMVAYWPYSDMNDKRFYAGPKYFTLRQDASCDGPFKFGLSCDESWCGYYIDGQFMKKTFSFTGNSYEYPDYGCNVESYTDHKMLEIESLGPVVTIQPGQCAELAEKWDITAAPKLMGLDPKSAAFADEIEKLVK